MPSLPSFCCYHLEPSAIWTHITLWFHGTQRLQTSSQDPSVQEAFRSIKTSLQPVSAIRLVDIWQYKIMMMIIITIIITSHVTSTTEQQHLQPSEAVVGHPPAWSLGSYWRYETLFDVCHTDTCCKAPHNSLWSLFSKLPKTWILYIKSGPC